MKWARRPQVFNKDGTFRCRVNRGDVNELLAQMPGHPPQADAECWKCHSTTEESACVGEKGHEWILILRPMSFDRRGKGPIKARGQITHAEIEANVGGYGLLPRVSVKRKLERMFEDARRTTSTPTLS
jgi:hypothetical protein